MIRTSYSCVCNFNSPITRRPGDAVAGSQMVVELTAVLLQVPSVADVVIAEEDATKLALTLGPDDSDEEVYNHNHRQHQRHHNVLIHVM